jgi:hypothetical protein
MEINKKYFVIVKVVKKLSRENTFIFWCWEDRLIKMYEKQGERSDLFGFFLYVREDNFQK